MSDKLSVGEVRSSQILWTYGPGALIDLPNLSVLTMGIDRWDEECCEQVWEPRLLSAVRNYLGPQVASLRMPPFQQSDDVNPFSPEAMIGVPVRPFPRWLRCLKCSLLSDFDNGLFKIKQNRYRPEYTQFVHEGCTGSKGNLHASNADVVPARFLLACRNGHLDDFPWHYFVHRGQSDCKGTLRFYERGASLQTENLWVQCDGCNAKINMAQAFGKSGKENLPQCRGRNPHLDHSDTDCKEEARTVLLGASNSWFPCLLSALAIPLPQDTISQLVRYGWEYFEDVGSEAEVNIVTKTLKKTDVLLGIEKYSSSEIWSVIEEVRKGNIHSSDSKTDIKGPEWDILTDANPPSNWPNFLSKPVNIPMEFAKHISGVLLLERLREVKALIGFTRIESLEESSEPDKQPSTAKLCTEKPTWVPAGQVHGEGLFIRFDEGMIKHWEEREAVKERNKILHAGHKAWRNARKLSPDGGYPGVRYVMLHTISHLLIRELSFECGYNAASIRERVYAKSEGEQPQAGILVYTAAADSDGTLGGLVNLGKPENLGPLLTQALSRARVCSSDPLCSEHQPDKDRSLHAASCHACSFLSETSCERSNRYIDRALVIPTLEVTDAAFFT